MASVKRGRGGLLVDLNGDGLLDMLVVNRWDKAQLWRNVGTGSADKSAPLPGHWLQLRLQQGTGASGGSGGSGSNDGNRDAIGAWVEVELAPATAQLAPRVIRQELTIGGGHASGHLGWMHFGLGAATQVRVRVQWPHGGGWSDWASANTDGFYVMSREKGLTAWRAP